MSFFLFLLVNAALFIRPGEIEPELQSLPIYLTLISACAIATFAVEQTGPAPRQLLANPITACVIGVFFAVVLSHLSRLALWDAAAAGTEFSKIVVYYILLVAVIVTPERLRWFLLLLIVSISVLTILALLQYHGWINIASLEVLQERMWHPETGELTLIPRLRSTGIFNDPNDLCLVLILGMGTCLYFVFGSEPRWIRGLALAALIVFAYALTLTQSRGGFLALLAGLLVLVRERSGWLKSLAFAGIAVPLLFLVFAGRQTSIDPSEGTAQDRLQLWSEGFALFREAPLFGIGHGRYADMVGLVAHNSYVHCYTELGFLGGTAFVGAFFLAVTSLRKVDSTSEASVEAELARFRPYLLAVVCGYMVGMFSLSRVYIVPTYLILGLVAAYTQMTSMESARAELRLLRRLLLVSCLALGGLYIFTRTFVSY
jgi:O-antigen ligase